MSIHPIPAEPESAADRHTQNGLHYQDLLHHLMDRGGDMARMIHEEAKAAFESPGPAHAADFAPAFDDMGRTVRRCIVLARKIAEPVADPARIRIATRQRIIRAVEDSIQRNADGPDADSLHAEFLERLDGPDLDDAIDDRPVAEIIAELCRDLGIDILPGAHPWKRRTPADIATLCARAAAPAPVAPPGRHAETGRRPERGRWPASA